MGPKSGPPFEEIAVYPQNGTLVNVFTKGFGFLIAMVLLEGSMLFHNWPELARDYLGKGLAHVLKDEKGK